MKEPRIKRRRQQRREKLQVKQKELPPRGLDWPGVFGLHQQLPEIPHRFPVILAPGKLGVEACQHFTEGDYFLAVNSAIMMPKKCNLDIEISIWFVQDPRVCGKKWFKEADRLFKGIRVFNSQAASITPSYAQADSLKTGFYVFDLCTPEQSALPWDPPKWRFRTDTTVTGSAAWFLKKCGCFGARLCGADYYGPQYFDETAHPHKAGMKIWPQRKAADAQFAWMIRNGFIISSMSKTALESVIPDCRIPGCPKKVYLIAPGPQGQEYYNKIPLIDPDTGKPPFIAVVGRSSLIDAEFDVPFVPDIWVASDKDSIRTDWWEAAFKHFKGGRYFANEIIERLRGCKWDGRFPIDTDNGWIYRSAGTVLGVALMILLMSGVEVVVLIGGDMSGNKYAGGGENKDPRWLREHGKIWTAVPVLDERIKYLKARGMRVLSMSPTKLMEVERI